MSKRAINAMSLRWALYDWANTAFAMAAALIFGPLFKAVWCDANTMPADRINLYFNLTLSAASLLVAVFAPVLAGAAESRGMRMRLLRYFAFTGAVMLAALGFVPPGCWWGAALVYVAGAMCFFTGNIFYDSMLTEVAEPEHRHTVSGLAFSFGYAAGVIILIALVATGAAGAVGGDASVRAWVFGVSGIWWALFSIPLLSHHEPKEARKSFPTMVRTGLAEARRTLKEIWAIKPLRRFLLAYIFYIDGVSTVIATAAYLGASVGFTTDQVMKAFFVVQVFGIPCAIGFGKLAEKFGARSLIAVALVVYLGVTAYGAVLRADEAHVLGFEIPPIFVLAGLVGIVQGGVQALSRSYYAGMIPVGRETAFFGFYSMIGKCATVFGPLVSAAACAVVVAFRPEIKSDPAALARTGFASLSVLFLLGLVFLAMARHAEKQAEQAA
jgi:UMF1 family MFS transporter